MPPFVSWAWVALTAGQRGCNCVCSTVCAYLIPPLGVFWRFGCGLEVLLCLVLTFLGYVPGLVYPSRQWFYTCGAFDGIKGVQEINGMCCTLCIQAQVSGMFMTAKK